VFINYFLINYTAVLTSKPYVFKRKIVSARDISVKYIAGETAQCHLFVTTALDESHWPTLRPVFLPPSMRSKMRLIRAVTRYGRYREEKYYLPMSGYGPLIILPVLLSLYQSLRFPYSLKIIIPFHFRKFSLIFCIWQP